MGNINLKNVYSNCSCNNQTTYLETEANTIKAEKDKARITQIKQKRHVKILMNFLKYYTKRRKIVEVHEKYLTKAKNLLLISSRSSKGNLLCQSQYISTLQRHIDKILNHIDSISLIDIERSTFCEINSYEYIANKVKDYYIKDIKENQINFYKEFIEGKKKNLNEEILKMLNYEYSYFYKMYFSNNFISKQVFCSQNFSFFIKHFYHMYLMTKLKYFSTYENYKKIPLNKLKKLTNDLINNETPQDYTLTSPARNSPYKQNKQIKISIYKGDYDSSTLLPTVRGELIKDYKKTFYNGTFRFCKKHGIGILYKIINDNNVDYYRGEFHKGFFNGYGLRIISKLKHYIIQEGVFSMSHFLMGTIYIIEDNVPIKDSSGKNISYTKLEGEFIYDSENGNEALDGNGKKTTIIFEQNRSTLNYDVKTSYHYEGFFTKGKECGKGKSTYTDNENNYSFNYNGEFYGGKMNGYGKIMYSDNFFIKSYEGLFYNDQKFYLYGIVRFKSGDVYEGFFDEHFLKSDLGLYLHYDGKFGGSIENYFGEFAKDKKEGIGRFVSLKKKKVLIGKYYGGDKNGVFSLITTKRNGNYDEDDISEDNEKNEFGRMSFKQRRAHKLYYNFENDDLIGEVDHGYILYQ